MISFYERDMVLTVCRSRNVIDYPRRQILSKGRSVGRRTRTDGKFRVRGGRLDRNNPWELSFGNVS